jgi:Ras-related protein Rab-5B
MPSRQIGLVGDREREGPMPLTPRAFVRYLRAWFSTSPPRADADLSLPVAGGLPQALAASAALGRDRDIAIVRAQGSSALDEAAVLVGGYLPVAGVESRPGRSALKIVVAGDGNVGKTSLIRRYAKHKFSEVRNQTLGIDITTQEFTIGGRDLALVLWDIEGQRGERPFFYYGANAALLVYDVTSPDSLEALTIWADRVRRYAPPGIPILVAGNKVDLPATVPTGQGRSLAERVGARDHLLLSARTEVNVARAFTQLAELASAAQLAAR